MLKATVGVIPNNSEDMILTDVSAPSQGYRAVKSVPLA